MVSSFNITQLKKLLRDFYVITQIRITVFDENFHEIVAYPDNIPLFCRLIRTYDSGENCRLCDMNACLKVKASLSPYTYRCHAGLIESITPIILGRIVVGYLMFGHIAPHEDLETGWKEVQQCCSKYPVDMEMLQIAYTDRRYFSDKYIHSASQIMNTVASYLCISHMAALKNDSLPLEIDRYLSGNLDKCLDSNTICDKFDISRTRLYQISTENFGMGITDYIRSLRIKKAVDLLETTRLSIKEIACLVGIDDYNYFSKVFKKETGFTPRDYRKKDEPEARIPTDRK